MKFRRLTPCKAGTLLHAATHEFRPDLVIDMFVVALLAAMAEPGTD